MSLVLNVEILGEFKKLTSATQGAQSELQTMTKRAASASKAITRSFAAIGVGLSFRFIANELKDAAQAAIEDTKSQALLANQLQNTTGATDAQVAAVERNISSLQLLTSIADDDLRPAMAQLTRATGDTGEATKLLALATDISAQTGKDLTSVSIGLSKAYNGQFGALAKLGIPMSDSIQNAQMYSTEMKKLTKFQSDANYALDTYGIKSKEYIAAQQKVVDQQGKVNTIAQAGIDWQAQLGEAFDGAAEKAANVDPYKRMQIIFGELQEQVGMALLPTLEKFSTWIASPEGQLKLQQFVDLVTGLAGKFEILAGWAIENGDAIIAWSGVIAGASIALKLFTTAMTVYNGIATLMAAKSAAAAVANTAVGTSAAAATPLLWGMNAAAAATAASLGLVALGAVGAGVGGYQQGVVAGQTAQIYSGGKRGQAAFEGFRGVTDLLGINTGVPKVTTNPGTSPRVAETVNINVNSTNATADDIIKKLDDYYKATGVRLSY